MYYIEKILKLFVLGLKKVRKVVKQRPELSIKMSPEFSKDLYLKVFIKNKNFIILHNIGLYFSLLFFTKILL